MDAQTLPGEIPDGWAMPRPTAIKFYGSLFIAEVMESSPHSPIVEGFRRWLDRHDKAVTHTWGHPDILAARNMTSTARSLMAHETVLGEDQIAALETGVLIPSLGFLLMVASDMNWPVGVFFRSELHVWHPRTALGRAMAQIGEPGGGIQVRFDDSTGDEHGECPF